MKHTVKEWLVATRFWSFSVSAMPVIVTVTFLMWKGYDIRWLCAVLALVGNVMFHAAGNVLSDWWDYRKGVDNEKAYAIPQLVFGQFTPREYLTFSSILFAVAICIGLVLTCLTGWELLIIGGIISTLSGKIEIAHMWYVENLLFFCLVYALIRKFWHPISGECSSKPTLFGMLVLGGVMGVGSYLIRQVSPQDHWIWPFGIIPLPMEPAHYLQYVMMFVLCILARRFNWLEKLDNTTGCLSLLIGCALAIGIYVRNGGWWSDFVTQWFGIYESVLCVFLCFGLLWFFKQYLNGTSALMQWCASQAYGAYIVHLLLMLGLQFATDGWWMGAVGKFLFIGIVTTLESFALTWLLRCIPGVKKVI